MESVFQTGLAGAGGRSDARVSRGGSCCAVRIPGGVVARMPADLEDTLAVGNWFSGRDTVLGQWENGNHWVGFAARNRSMAAAASPAATAQAASAGAVRETAIGGATSIRCRK